MVGMLELTSLESSSRLIGGPERTFEYNANIGYQEVLVKTLHSREQPRKEIM